MRVHSSLIQRILRRGLAVTAATAIGPALAIGLSPASAAARPAAAFSFTVNSAADSHDAKAGDGKCADSLGRCTLRAAIEEAGADPAGSTITISVPAGTYQLSLGSLTESANTITVTGAGASATTVKATGSFRVLQVDAKVIANLTGVTISGGNAGGSGYGGGVLSSGTTTIIGSTITSNSAASGGGVSNSGGKLTITASTVSGNSATSYGGAGIQNGGLSNLPGTVKVTSSTVSNNMASDDGGGILNGQNGHPATIRSPAVPLLRHTVHPGAALPARPTAPHTRPAVAGLILTVTNSKIGSNSSDNAGGAIANDGGTTTVTGSTISGNSVPAAIGGGIETYGPLTVTKSTISGNSAFYGGGIEAYYGGVPGSTTVTQSTLKGNNATIGAAIDDSTTVSIDQSTLSGNKAAQAGGGVEVEGSSSLSVTNSTITANTAVMAGNGGGIQTYQCSGGTVSYSTITGNSTGLDLSCSTMQLTGTIVASSTSGANCNGAAPTESAGYNLDSGTSCGFSKPTDLNSTSPGLGALGNNGGPTQTELPMTGSPVIDHGSLPSNGCPSVDQRGDPRLGDPACDIGSVEVQS